MKFVIDVGEINRNKEAGLEVKANGRVNVFPKGLRFHNNPSEYMRVVGDVFAFGAEEPKDRGGAISFEIEKNGERVKIDHLYGDDLPKLVEIENIALRVQQIK